MHSLSVIFASIAIIHILLTTNSYSLDYSSAADSVGLFSTTLT